MAESANRRSPEHDRVWPDDGREAEIRRVAGMLVSPQSAGVAVLGGQGVGKTWVAGKALATVDADVYTLRATPLASQVPLGALGPLLTHLNERPSDALTALHLLGRHFDSLGPGRRVIVYVCRAQHLDDASAMVLGQLVVGRHAKLLVTSGPGMHHELMDLIDSDGLSVIRLSPLPPRDVKRIIRAYLGSVVSARAEAAIVGAVNGNPSCLMVLLDELLASGTLAQRGGVWTLTRPGIQDWIHPGGLHDARARLERLPDQQRDILEIVALCEPVTWPLLIDATSPDQIDELVDLGFLAVSGKPTTVAFQQTVFAEALRQSVPVNRRLDIRARLNAHVDRAHLPLTRLAGFVDLDLACGQPVPLADAVTIAQFSLDSNRAGYALAVLDAAAPDSSDPGGQPVDWQLLRASALVGAVGPEAGRDELEKLCQRDDLDVDTFVEVHTRTAEVSWATGDADGAERVLARAVRGLARYPDGPAGAAASRRLRVDQLHMAVQWRRYAESIEPLQDVLDDPELESDLRVKAAKALAESALLTGRLSLALDTVRWFVRLLESGPQLPMSLYWQGGSVAVAVCLEANQWSTATALVDRVMDRAGRFPVIDRGVTDTTQGAELLRRGQIHAALEFLERGIATFEAFNRARIYPHTAALAGSAYAALGNHQRAAEYLERSEGLLRQSWVSGHVATEVQLRVLTARLWMGEVSAHANLPDFADQMRRSQIPVAEMHALFALARAGDSSVLAHLISTAHRVEGESARIIKIYAEAKLANDPEGFAAAAELAETTGQMFLAAGLAAEGLSATGPTEGDTPGLRNVLRALINRCRNACGDVGDAPFRADDTVPEALTQREREIVRYVAAGRSNREIADALTVSVRTIEGHLYRIYPKLGVAHRGELGQIIDA